MYPEAFQTKAPEVKETTVGGQVKEFFKGLVPGAIGMVESGAIGASALLPQEQEKAARTGIASLASAAKKPFEAAPGYEETVGRKFGEAGGSIIPFLGLGPLGVAGRVGMAALGAGAGAGEARTRAEQGGATESERATATALGTAVGLTEMFAPARILGRVATPAKAGAIEGVKRALMAGGEEAAQEAASQAAQNMIAKGLYKPEQEIIEQVGESAAYGGAVGAMAQGLFDLALGRRAKTPSGQKEEFATLRAEEEKRIEAERQRKTTPDYAKEVVAQYDELAKQKQDLKAQLKTVVKDSATADADRAYNKQITAQLSALDKQLEPLAGDYHGAKQRVTQMAEQERVAKLTPEQYAYDQVPVPSKEQGPEYYEQQIVSPEKPKVETPETKLADYANQRVAMANDQMYTAENYSSKYKSDALQDYTNYLMQDFNSAQQLVQSRPTMEGLPKGLRSDEVYNALKLRVGAEAKEVMKQREQEQSLSQQKLTEPKDKLALYKESEAQVEEQRTSTEHNFEYLDPLFEKALAGKPGVVKVNEKLLPLREAPTVRKTVEGLLDTVEQSNKDYAAFNRQNNPDAATAAFQKGNAANEQLNFMSAEKPAGTETKGLKNGPTEEDTRASYARELIAVRRAQQNALAELEDAASRIRAGETLGKENMPVGKGMAANTEQGLVNMADKARAQYISNALQEAAIHRRAAGKPALTTDEALTAASKLNDTFSDLIARAREKNQPAQYEEVIVQPAQMRANKIVRPAVTERREVAPATKTLSEAELKHFKARAETIRNRLSEEVTVEPRRVETGPLKRQFAEEEARKTTEARGETATTLRGELARRTEYVRNKMAKMGAMRPGARDALNAAADIMDSGKATREILDKVENMVDAIVSRRDVRQVDIQAIKDAVAATRPTALEQKAAGQTALFPETTEDIGYIRVTPANFAKSPRIKPVWEAIQKARDLFKKSEQERLVKKATAAKRMKLLEKLQAQMDNIRSSTQFFWKDTAKWSDTELAKVFAGVPEAGKTAQDKAILYKYVKGQNLTAQERATADRLLNEYRQQELPKYKAKLQEALSLLAQGRRLNDADNQLLGFMQDTNANVRKAAEEMNKQMEVFRTAVKHVKDTLSKSAALSPEQKMMLDSENAVKKQRDVYERAVEKSIQTARRDMDAALAFMLDPLIAKTNADLKAAQAKLVKEKAELNRINDRFTEALDKSKPSQRTELATYELFKYEEKKGIIDDLEKQIEEQTNAFNELVEERSTEYDGSYAVAQAMLDSNVKLERQYLEMLEANLASMRGESVLDNPNSYPFAYQQAEKNMKVQQQAVKAAEKRATEFKEVAKSDQQKMEDFWQDKLGGEGIKRDEGKVSRIETKAEKEAKKLREDAMVALEKEEEAFAKDARKEQILKTFADQMGDLLLEAEAIPGPNDVDALRKIINDPKSELDDVINAQAKVGVLQAIQSIEAQEEVYLEGKPRKKQRVATTLSSIGQAKGKPLRTGRMNATRLHKLFKEEPAAKLEGEIASDAWDTSTDIANEFGGGKTQGSFDFNGDFNFSRGESTTGTNAIDLKDELDEAMGTDVTARGNVRIYDNVESFIKKFPAYAGKIPSDAKGFAENGRATLFANNIGKGHGLGVLLHEVGVHIGFRNFFNAAQFNRLVSTVKKWGTLTDNSIEAQIGRKAAQRVETAETPEAQVDDELLAYAVEEAVQAGVMGTKKGSAYGWLSTIIDAFKKALAKLGIPTSNITAGDLVNYAYGCAQLELRGTWHGTGGVFDQFDFDFMSTGEGAQAFSWGTYRAQKYGIADYYRGKEARKQLNEWEQIPEVAKWDKTQQPTFNGYSIDDFFEFKKNTRVLASAAGKPVVVAKGQKDTLGGVPVQYAAIFASALKEMHRNANDYVALSPADLLKIELGSNPPLKYGQKEYEEFVAGLDLTKLNAVSTEPLYKGVDWIHSRSYDRTDERNVAGQVLWLIRGNKEGTFEERLKNAFKDEIAQQEEYIDVFSSNPQSRMYTEAVQTLAALKKLDLNDFVFNPPTAPPVPKPTGVMLRTLHTRPEDTYLLWNASAEYQPPPVDKAIKDLFNDLTDRAQQKFLMLLPNKQAKGRDIYEALAGTVESQRAATEIMAAYGISGNKFLDSDSRGKPITKKSTYNYVDFVDKEEGAHIIAHNIDRVGKAKGILLSRNAQYANADFESVGDTIRKTVAQNKSWWDKVKANTTGLAFETQVVDRFAGFERLAKYMDNLAGTQMLYYLRSYDQRMNIVSKAVADGAPTIKEITRKDGRIERVVETSGGASITRAVNTLKDAKQYIGNGEAVNQVFTTYMAAIRAENKGIETLNFGTDKDGKPVLTQAMLNEVTALVNKTPGLKKIFEEARREYNQYNRDMLNFVAETGALSKDLVKKLVAEDDYIPFYRERKGVIELVIGNENPIRIGSIAEQPYLDKLVGGDTAILDFMTSSVQNTNMLVDMGMRNLATKNAIMELVDLKAATITKKTEGSDVVKFKVNGEDRYAIVHTEKVKIGNKEFDTGIPADILVKGMEGIPTQMPFLLRAMAMPAQVLRKAVTLSPLYMAKQLFRDSLAAPIMSGANFMPIIGALREINGAAKETLEKRGIIGGQQFRGTSEDLSKILRDIAGGQSGWMKALGTFEAMGMEADALTRRAQYNSYIEQGLSEMEATLLSLESMNFNKRGASPSIHVANALIPFFNAQIQGLNVLYKAMAGKMPFNDQLRIREKLLMRGGMIAGSTILYAMMMQDDEAYKNATPDQKYGNWFVRIPGLDEPLRIPVPFEIGYVFKAIPEALYNSMTQKHGGEEAVQALNQILINVLPGGSSMATIDVGNGLKVPTLIPIPQAIKPAIEQALEKSFFTGRDLLSEREKGLLPEEQYRANTSEAAKLIGSVAGLSPIKIEALINGYTGSVGLAFMQAISLGVPAKETPEQAVKRLSEYPIVGGAFQPNDAGGIINSVYIRMNEAERVKSTVTSLMNDGKVQEANDLLTRRGADYMQAELANVFKTNMNMLAQAERAIAVSNMTAEEKRKQLDSIRKMKIGLANTTREISDKTIHLIGSF